MWKAATHLSLLLPVIIPINSVSASCENVISRPRAPVEGGGVGEEGVFSWSEERHTGCDSVTPTDSKL